MFGRAGFDANRDIAGIILNRWGHAYLSPQPGFFFGKNGQPGPGDVLRQTPYGRIAFANIPISPASWTIAPQSRRPGVPLTRSRPAFERFFTSAARCPR